MKKSFAVGERVRAFGIHNEEGWWGELDGEVTEVNPNNTVTLRVTSGYGATIDMKVYAHVKQCRRLKPKKKPERERIERWLLANKYHTETSGGVYLNTIAAGSSRSSEYCDVIRVVEIREGELIVDELMLGTAMDDCGDTVFRGVGNALMKMFIKELRKYQGVSMKGEGA